MEKGNLMVFVKSGLIALFLLILAYPSFAQVNTEQLSTTVIDTVDDEEDLFDENTNYKELYKDLNKDGDWVQIKESDLDNDSGDPESVNTEVTNIRIINVWRPRNMGSDWSPYSEGRWVYTYSGWVWATDYDWGWAAYHYGRWVFNEMWGWLWMPGRYWAPSWVQWSYTSDYIGWYPIYPRCYGWHRYGHYGRHDRYYHGGRHHHWVFVNRNRFTERINKNVVVDKSKYSDILSISKNKAIVKFDGTSIVNVGPKVQTIEKNTGQKISPKEINHNSVKGVTKVDNNSVSIYRNDISKKDKVTNQNSVKNKETNNTSINGNNTKKKDTNTGTKTKAPNNEVKTKAPNNEVKTKAPNNSTKTKDSNSGTKSKDNNTYKNKESTSTKGSSPPKESTKNRESNTKRESTSRDTNRGSTNRESTNRESNTSRGNKESNSSKGNSNTKSSNRK